MNESAINGFSYNELFLLAIKKPVLAQIEITKNCNQRCFFCFRKCQPEKKFVDQNISVWQKAIIKLLALGIEKINFSGGEVFLYKNFDKLLAFAKENGVKEIIVNTNGLVSLNKRQLKYIDELVFSVHGLKDLHEEITGVRGSFSIIENNIKFALKNKCKVGINTVISKNNYRQMQAIYDYFRKYKLTFHCFNLAIDRANIRAYKDEVKKIFPAYLKFLKIIPDQRLKLRHGMHNIFINDREFFSGQISLPHCAGGKYKIIIDFRGDIYPCRYFQNKDYYCGNIFRDNLRKVWQNGKGFKKFRQLILRQELPSQCNSCIKKYKCRGGCLAWRIFNSDLKKHEKDIRCEFGHAYLGS